MYYHREKDILYLAHPRTASVATGRALFDNGFAHTPDHHGTYIKAVRELNWNLSPSHTMILTTVRNHWDWLVSWFFASGKGHNEENKFNVDMVQKLTDDKLWFLQPHRMFALHTPFATHIIRFEHLEEDLNRHISTRGYHEIKIPMWNDGKKREHRHYSEFYDDETREWVATRFRQEINELGYVFSQER